MKRVLFFTFAIAMSVISCAPQRVIYKESECAPQRVIYKESEVRNLEPTQSAVVVPFVAELELISQQRVSELYTFDIVVTTAMLGEIENYKRNALLKTAQKYNADTMVGALISVDTDKKGKLEILVTGYPARYVNFRSMTKEEAWLNNTTHKGVVKTEDAANNQGGLVNLFNRNK